MKYLLARTGGTGRVIIKVGPKPQTVEEYFDCIQPTCNLSLVSKSWRKHLGVEIAHFCLVPS